jgi:nitroreductase / dihydropteridine reductase
MEFKELIMKRYAAKKFDGKKISDEDLNTLLEIIRFSASSSNVQPWKIKIISDKETKEKLAPASYNQPQITTCSHLLVFCANIDVMGNVSKLEKEMVTAGTPVEKAKAFADMTRGMLNSFDKKNIISWAQRQLYIALGNAINGATSLGFYSCPMEGFQPEEYSRILALPENLIPTALVAIGYAIDKPGPKIRLPKEDIIF